VKFPSAILPAREEVALCPMFAIVQALALMVPSVRFRYVIRLVCMEVLALVLTAAIVEIQDTLEILVKFLSVPITVILEVSVKNPITAIVQRRLHIQDTLDPHAIFPSVILIVSMVTAVVPILVCVNMGGQLKPKEILLVPSLSMCVWGSFLLAITGPNAQTIIQRQVSTAVPAQQITLEILTWHGEEMVVSRVGQEHTTSTSLKSAMMWMSVRILRCVQVAHNAIISGVVTIVVVSLVTLAIPPLGALQHQQQERLWVTPQRPVDHLLVQPLLPKLQQPLRLEEVPQRPLRKPVLLEAPHHKKFLLERESI